MASHSRKSRSMRFGLWTLLRQHIIVQAMYSELYFGTVFAQIPLVDSSRPVLARYVCSQNGNDGALHGLDLCHVWTARLATDTRMRATRLPPIHRTQHMYVLLSLLCSLVTATQGDVHYYNYEADCWDVSTFPRPRFASEYARHALMCPCIRPLSHHTPHITHRTPH